MAAYWSPGQNSFILKLLQVQESDFFPCMRSLRISLPVSHQQRTSSMVPFQMQAQSFKGPSLKPRLSMDCEGWLSEARINSLLMDFLMNSQGLYFEEEAAG